MRFDSEKFVIESVKSIKDTITGKAIIAVSGGVDSTVATALVSKAIEDDLLAVFIDTGLMRKGEPEEVKNNFLEMGINFKFVEEKELFLNALKGVTDPEQKRKIIGEKFIRVFEREADKFAAEYLVQGTIAPDWIESGEGIRETIKTHHNVGGVPKDVALKIVEPLRDLYKDEVRALARYLNLKVSERQPFPGPGLAIRVIGAVTDESLQIAREANHILEVELMNEVKAGKLDKPWQYFAVVLPVKTVGVHGDKRAYGYTVAIRAVNSLDGMSATFTKLPFELLDRVSIKITNTLKLVNRVVYDITNKPPATIEWE